MLNMDIGAKNLNDSINLETGIRSMAQAFCRQSCFFRDDVCVRIVSSGALLLNYGYPV